MSDNLVSTNKLSNLNVQNSIMQANAEENKCRSVFPEEIWLIIGDKLKDFGTYQRLRESSTYLWDLLENSWIRWFPQFAEILYKQLQDCHEDVQHVIEKCRLVCRHWNKSINAILQNPLISLHLLRRHTEPVASFGLNLPYDILGRREINNITRFQQQFAIYNGDTNRNPFLYRSVSIAYGPEQMDNLIEQVLQVLRKYGQHIWHCDIDLIISSRYHNPLDHYRNLYAMLDLLPNLRTLTLDCSSFGSHLETDNGLELYFKTHALPTLRHLKFLEMRCLPPSLAKNLMRANPQITALLSNWSVNTISFQENLQHLEQLSTELHSKQEFRMLESSSSVWPLRQLYLEISYEISKIDLLDLLGKRCSATLTQLTLRFLAKTDILDVAPLHLPNLQVFTVTGLCLTSLEFLLPSKTSLKRLAVHVDTRWLPDLPERLQTTLEAEKTVKFLGFCNNLLESNIWSIFPNLKTVEYIDYANGENAKPNVYQRLDWMLKQIKKA